ncbi:MAG: cobalamin-binding protein [Lysobacterales bacterium]
MHRFPAGDRRLQRRLWPALSILVCMLSHASAGAAVVLRHSDGGELVLDDTAQRIVTLAPNLAELVFSAGAGERLVGTVEYSNFPPAARQVPRVGDAFRIDLEGVLALRPDLVIAWPSGNPPGALQKLARLGIKVWRIEIHSPEEIADSVEHIARAAGSEPTGLALATQLRQRLEALRLEHADKTPVSYFYQVSARPLYTVNGAHIISRALALCGANNVFAGLSVLAPQVSREAVVAVNPMALIAPRAANEPADLEAWRDWPAMRAVRNQALFYLPADSISQATPRLLDVLDSACRLVDEARHRAMKESSAD